MTVEEGAENVMSIFRCMLIETIDGRVLTGIDLMNRIAEALRDQIEDCAQVAINTPLRIRADAPADETMDYCAEQIATAIRALAAPREEKEGER